MKQEFPYKVIKGGKTVAQASTLAEARAEAKRCGGVATAGRGYAKRNPKTERQKLEDLVWSNTHRDFRGKFADGTKMITMFVPKVGTTLVPLSQLTDAQLRERLPQGVKQRNPSRGANKNSRAMNLNQRDYTHYVVDTRTGKIVSGWSYADDAKDAQKELVEAFPSAKGSIKVVAKRSLSAHGCTADDNACWGNVVEMSGAKRNPSMPFDFDLFAENEPTAAEKRSAKKTSETIKKSVVAVGNWYGKPAFLYVYGSNPFAVVLGHGQGKNQYSVHDVLGEYTSSRQAKAELKRFAERLLHGDGSVLFRRNPSSGTKQRNPSEAHHVKEATGQLQYAQNLSDRAKAAHSAGKVKDARSLWAQTLETASAAYENAMGVPTEQGSAMRQAARKLREQAYNYLVK